MAQQKTTVFDNKIGGVPYFPKNMKYPTSTVTKKPLSLLAQLNFDNLPHIDDFPSTGILQIFIEDEECYGMDFDDKCSQNRYRIVYHTNIIQDESKLISAVHEISDLPFSTEYLLIPDSHQSIMYATTSVENFDKEFTKIYNEIHSDKIDDIYDLDDDQLNEIYDRNDNHIAWIGGYPIFAQSDPRYNKYAKYDTLLFELDSYWSNKENIKIMWGDSGTGTIFIPKSNLENLDFSDTMYSWDCC